MTDRGRPALRQTRDQFTVGPSSLHWTGSELVIDVDERGAPPFFGRIRGRITLTPSAITSTEVELTRDRAHLWRPFAPVSAIDVDLDARGWQWQGHGYFDANFGSRALEADFDYWTWGRFPTPGGAVVYYDAKRRDGSEVDAEIAFDREGQTTAAPSLPKTRFARSLWAVRRETRADPATKPHQVKSMLDAPFYSRAMVETSINGTTTVGVHEALDLRRFRSPLLMPMLACRVPRRRNWRFADYSV